MHTRIRAALDDLEAIESAYHSLKIKLLGIDRDMRELVEVLSEARTHLDWIGWGDSYERECAVESGLPAKIDDLIAKHKGEQL